MDQILGALSEIELSEPMEKLILLEHKAPSFRKDATRIGEPRAGRRGRAATSLVLGRSPLAPRATSNVLDGAGHLGRGLNRAVVADFHRRLVWVCDIEAEGHLIPYHRTGDLELA